MFGLDDFRALPHDQQEALLDAAQLTLDLIGIVEPTPFADSTNAAVSVWRHDWLGAGISLLGVVPYLGDLAKLGKIPKYLAKIEHAVELARADKRFAELLAPVLNKLRAAIDRVPLDKVPAGVRTALERLRRMTADFLPGGGRAAAHIDRLAEETLRRVMGSTVNVGLLPRRNVRTAVEFFAKHGVPGGPAEWAELLKGIDLHAVKPITVTTFHAGEVVAEYVVASKIAAGREVGQWMVRVRGAVSAGNLGLSADGKVRRVFRLKHAVEVLESKAAGAADHWTYTGLKAEAEAARLAAPGARVPAARVPPHHAVTVKDGVRVRLPADQVAGGGTQYFLPKAWEHLDRIDPLLPR